MTTDLTPALDMDEPAPEFACDTRERALSTLRRIARSTGREPDEGRAGVYTRFVPGRLALLYDDASGNAWLCSTTVDGRLATLEAAATWEVQP